MTHKKNLWASLFLEKRGQIGKKSKKSWYRHQLRTMTYFSKYHTFDPLLYLGCQMLGTLFFFTFSAKNRSNNKIFGKKNLWASTRSHDPFLTTPKFDLLSYIHIINFLNLPVHALIHDLQKKNLWASTRTHDPFFDNPKIWPTFIYRGEVPPDTFAKLPVCALINDPKKKLIQKSTTTHAPFFDNPKIWPTFIYPHHQFFKSSCACSNSWPTKKKPTGIN